VVNVTASSATGVTVSDILPDGMTWVPNSLAASLNNQPVRLTEQQTGGTVLFTLHVPLPAGMTLRIIYALTVGPGAVLGQSKSHLLSKAHLLSKSHLLGPATNVATVTGTIRSVVAGTVLDSCGTIIGRVFVDAKGDGRQEAGDTPVAHAVIVLDDGARIQTDEHGLFHVECTHPGWRTGTLDLTSIPGYGIPTNGMRLDQRSATVSVHLEPNGLVRMNFPVVRTAANSEGKQ
jgi:hypothetical protein